jgi:hypothetical protein
MFTGLFYLAVNSAIIWDEPDWNPDADVFNFDKYSKIANCPSKQLSFWCHICTLAKAARKQI